MHDAENPTRSVPRLLAARRRYAKLRAALRCDCELDLDLHVELTETIRMLDTKIARDRGDSPRA